MECEVYLGVVAWVCMDFFDEGTAVVELYVFCRGGFGGSGAVGVVGVGDLGAVWEGNGFDAVVVAVGV